MMTSEERYILRLRRLASIVHRKYFKAIKGDLKEDLISVAVIKAYNLTISSGFDPKRSSMRTYLFTGMRNEMTNYLYHMKKDVPVEFVDTEVAAPQEIIYPRVSDIKKTLDDIGKGDFLYCVVHYFKNELCLPIQGRCTRIVEVNLELVEPVIVYVMWKLLFTYSRDYGGM